MVIWNPSANRFELNGQPIVRWKVNWLTPKGLAETIQEYVHVCQDLDMLPDLMLRPVVIAVSATGTEEAIIR
jgi:hypothetical protein